MQLRSSCFARPSGLPVNSDRRLPALAVPTCGCRAASRYARGRPVLERRLTGTRSRGYHAAPIRTVDSPTADRRDPRRCVHTRLSGHRHGERAGQSSSSVSCGSSCRPRRRCRPPRGPRRAGAAPASRPPFGNRQWRKRRPSSTRRVVESDRRQWRPGCREPADDHDAPVRPAGSRCARRPDLRAWAIPMSRSPTAARTAAPWQRAGRRGRRVPAPGKEHATVRPGFRSWNSREYG